MYKVIVTEVIIAGMKFKAGDTIKPGSKIKKEDLEIWTEKKALKKLEQKPVVKKKQGPAAG